MKMSGKRILDAIALLRVSRNVAAKHFAIRFSQVELYTKTSSIVKALREKTAPGFAQPSQSFTQSAFSATRHDQPIPDPDSVPQSKSNSHEEGLNQDHHYARSRDNATQDPVPQEDLDIEQAKARRQPLPDGTIPPEDSPIGQEKGDAESFNQRPVTEPAQYPVEAGAHHDLSPKASSQSSIPNPTGQPLSALDAKKLQRQYEHQIPAVPAEPPSSEASELRIDQETDSFYQPDGASAPVLSALPRVKVPKVENDVQDGTSTITKDINADVYYSGAKREDEPDDETLSKLFHSPRASQLLRKISGGSKPRQFHTISRLHQQQPKSEQEDLRRLANDMAKDLATGDVSCFT